DAFLFQGADEISEAVRLVACICPPDADYCRIVREIALWIWLDRLVETKRRTFGVGPVRRRHPAVIRADDPLVRAVAVGQIDLLAAREVLWELEDVAYRCPSKPVQALVLIANDADVPSCGGQHSEHLFLNVVRVLVLVYEDVAHTCGYRAADLRIQEQPVDER